MSFESLPWRHVDIVVCVVCVVLAGIHSYLIHKVRGNLQHREIWLFALALFGEYAVGKGVIFLCFSVFSELPPPIDVGILVGVGSVTLGVVCTVEICKAVKPYSPGWLVAIFQTRAPLPQERGSDTNEP